MMKKVFARAGLVLACGLAVSATADYNITLDDSNLSLNVNGQACQLVSGSGQPIDAINIARTGSSATVNVTTAGAAQLSCMEYVPGQPVSSSSSSVSSISSASSSSSAGGGTPSPGIDLSACGGSWPANTVEGNILSLAGAGKAEQRLLGNNTISFPAQTLDPNKYSRLIINGLSNTLGVARQVWVSECPGGPAVAASACSSNSMESTTIRLQQGPKIENAVVYCNLQENKQYFINVKNSTCSSSTSNCGFYREIK